MEQKVNAVKSLTQGVSMLFKKNKVTPVNGVGRITDPHTIVVTGKSGETKLTTKNIMIATGSEVAPLPGIQARSHAHCLPFTAPILLQLHARIVSAINSFLFGHSFIITFIIIIMISHEYP